MKTTDVHIGITTNAWDSNNLNTMAALLEQEEIQPKLETAKKNSLLVFFQTINCSTFENRQEWKPILSFVISSG